MPKVSAIIALLCLSLFNLAHGELQRPPADEPRQYGESTDAQDWRGLMRDTRYFIGYQVISIAVLYTLPESVTGWTDEQKEEYSLSVWWDNVRHPQIDSDDFYLNYILHPYWGAAYFVRARERGYGEWQSFGYSALMSSIYEFGAEALFEEPSIQDIVVTPILGSLLGRYFWHVRTNIRDREAERGLRSTGDKWLWVLTDPLGALNRKVDQLTGRESRWQLRPMRPMSVAPLMKSQGLHAVPREPVYGLELEIHWQ